MSLLEVKNLRVSFNTPDGVVNAVRGLSFDLNKGKTLAIVGESGSGKSVSTQTITGLTRGAKISGEAYFDGVDLLTADASYLRKVRGSQIGMIFQDPLSSLHPYYRVGWQIVEMIRAHESVSKRAARDRAIELLNLVGIPRAETRIDDFPHQFSGGMRQRVMIAMAMSLNPSLLVADEPTTALDVTVQAQVLGVMRKMQEQFGTAIILITHDLGVVADVADRIAVMYAGRIVESAPVHDIYKEPAHPYTRGLLDSIPRLDQKGQELYAIKGLPPNLMNIPPGCAFNPRCPMAQDVCRTDVPPLYEVNGEDSGRRSACHFWRECLDG